MYKCGEIYNVDFGKNKDSVQSGIRPAIIVSNNIGNANSPNVIVIPLTSKIKKENMPTHVVIEPSKENGLKYKSMALCENLTTISKKQLNIKIGNVRKENMAKISCAMYIATTSLSYIEAQSMNEFINYLLSFCNKSSTSMCK